MDIDPSEANAPGMVMDSEADADLAREVESAIATILASQAASLDAASSSVAAKERRNQEATLNILKQLCGDDGTEADAASSSSSASAAITAAASAPMLIDNEALQQMFAKLKEQVVLRGDADSEAMSDGISGRSDHSSGLHLPDQAHGQMDVPEAQCTQEQTGALSNILTWLQADLTHAAGGHSALVPAPPLLFIHGPGGASMDGCLSHPLIRY